MDVVEGLEEYIPEVRARSRDSFILSASSDGDSLTMWRYYGRDQVSFAVGLDRSETLVPVARFEKDSHPSPFADYYVDKYDLNDDGQILKHPNGSPVVNFDPDSMSILGGEWKLVVYDQAQQSKIVTEIFESLRRGVEKSISTPEDGRLGIWFFPYFMNESLDLIKNDGFRDEREERIIVWLNPDWKFVFHRPGPFGLVPS
ncbi:hypothetical protein [Arthrobacter sp. MMS18-M83]|uniref:hypothetical protein n=1 Tax=Arthrobacter sp. MMS18-M83 TaxID=2996261 RepID=UPI00227CAE83|nr:hypothetical protein [Arthrobacter sp. MMS18-M83]WAH97400.1 hypothetical protein OW521_00375 [Arthrobacter sp. MMS18-M83]